MTRLHENLSAIPGDGDLKELYSGILLRLRPKYLCEAIIMLQIAYILSHHAYDFHGKFSSFGSR
jgi:hypothetical protein